MRQYTKIKWLPRRRVEVNICTSGCYCILHWIVVGHALLCIPMQYMCGDIGIVTCMLLFWALLPFSCCDCCCCSCCHAQLSWSGSTGLVYSGVLLGRLTGMPPRRDFFQLTLRIVLFALQPIVLFLLGRAGEVARNHQ